MSAPFIFVTTHTVKDGQLDAFRAKVDEFTRFVEEHEPGLLAHYSYLDPDRREVSLVQVHADAASADHHMQVAGELIGQGLALTEANVRIEVYGAPGPTVAGAIERNASNGTQVSVKETKLAGFARPSSG